MKIKLIIGIIFSIGSTILHAQQSKVSGIIINQQGEPASFVKLMITGTQLGAVTDQDGKFEIKGIPAGTHHLTARFTGMETIDTTLVFTTDTHHQLSLTMQSTANELEEVVITGTLKEISRDESPVAIEVITPLLFQKNPTPSIFESLSMVNGVRPQLQCNVCNTGDIHINGMEGPYTMVMIDGMPIMSALGTVYGLMGIPNSIIDRVEIQKGPASTLYGSEAVGGLINVITKTPKNAPIFSFDITGSTYQDFNSDIGVRYKLGKSGSGLFSGNVFYFNHLWDINEDNFTDVTLQKRYAAFNKISFTHKSGNTSSIAFRYFYENRWGGQLNWTEDWRGSDSIYGESIFTHRIELIGSSPVGFLGKGAKIQYSYNTHLQNSAYGNTPYSATQHIGFLQIIKNFTTLRHDVMSGIAVRYTYYDDNTMITQTKDSLNPQNKPSQTYLPGIFIQDEIKLNEKNNLLAGVRYDYNNHHGHVVSPRLNWKWSMNKYHILRVGIGNGYRVVNLFSEDHAAFSGAREVVIVDDLKPERSWNGTINMSSYINFAGGFLNIESSLFYTYFCNKIVADYFSNANQVIFDNLDGYGVTQGAGLMAHCSFTIPLKIIIGATFTDVHIWEHDENGVLVKTEQVHAPPLTGNFVVGYTFKKIKLGLDLTGNVYSPMLLPVLPNDYRPDHSPWFSLLNIQVTKDFNSGLKLYCGVKNLLNFIPDEDPIMRPFDPFDKNVNDPVNNPNGYTFDPGYNYAPLQGIRFFAGVRFALQAK